MEAIHVGTIHAKPKVRLKEHEQGVAMTCRRIYKRDFWYEWEKIKLELTQSEVKFKFNDGNTRFESTTTY